MRQGKGVCWSSTHLYFSRPAAIVNLALVSLCLFVGGAQGKKRGGGAALGEQLATDPAIETNFGALKSFQAERRKAETAGDERAQAKADASIERETAQALKRVEARPNDAAAQNSGARYLLQAGSYEKALAHAERAVPLAEAKFGANSPQANSVRGTRAMARYVNKDYPGACKESQRILAQNRKDILGIEVARFSCERTAGQPAATPGPPRTPGSSRGQAPELGRLINQTSARIPHSFDQWIAFQQESPSAAAPWIDKVIVSRRAGRLSEALKSAHAAVAADANDPVAWFYRGWVRQMMGDNEKAMLDLAQAEHLGLAEETLYRLRAEALIALKRYDAAWRDADMAVRLNPEFAAAYYLRGNATMQAGRLNETAVADFKRAGELDPKFSPFFMVANETLEKVRAKERAAAEQTRAEVERAAAEAKMAASSRGGFPTWLMGILGALGAGLLLWGLYALSKRNDRSGASSADSRATPASDNGATGARGQHEGSVGNGRYRLGRERGRGGMSVTREAFDTHVSRHVAVKMLLPELTVEARQQDLFGHEARVTAALEHPNIPHIYDYGRQGALLFIVMELIDGQSLQELLYDKGRLSAEETLKILRPVCSALGYAHGERVLHRDIKPGNIMIDRKGTVKLMDFGIARVCSKPTGSTQTSNCYGTAPYMAPEAWESGLFSRESDTFALGVSAYQTLSERFPFDGKEMQSDKRAARFAKISVYRPELAGLDGFFEAALSPQPERRFKSAAEFIDAFARAVQPVGA